MAETSGQISEEAIREAIATIRQIADSYSEIQKAVNDASQQARENWIGKGRNAFQTQYSTLIRKIDDFGDTLSDIYNGLVDAAAAYVDTDTTVMQGFVKTTESMA